MSTAGPRDSDLEAIPIMLRIDPIFEQDQNSIWIPFNLGAQISGIPILGMRDLSGVLHLLEAPP